MVKVQRWELQIMDSLIASGKDVVLQKNMHLHVDTGHHLQNASLFSPVMMVEGMIDGIISIGTETETITSANFDGFEYLPFLQGCPFCSGMEEMVHTVDAHR
jgi:hypothetical protein